MKSEYDRLKEQQEKASEVSAVNFTKKKTVNTEMKVIREQKEETLRFKRLNSQRDKLIRQRYIVQLYHNEKNVDELNNQIVKSQSECETYTEDKKKYESDTKESKKLHAKATKEVLLLEKKLKNVGSKQQALKPNLLAVKEKIKYDKVKLRTSEDSFADAKKAAIRQEDEVKRLELDLKKINDAIQDSEAFISQEDQAVDLGQEQMKQYILLKSQVDQKAFKEKEELKVANRKLNSVKDGII